MTGVPPSPEKPAHEKTLADFLREVYEHRKANPSHGTNCICMDRITWEMKAQMREVIPNPTALTVDKNTTELQTLWSFNHVLGMIVRSL